jgi:hypothetical protein
MVAADTAAMVPVAACHRVAAEAVVAVVGHMAGAAPLDCHIPAERIAMSELVQAEAAPVRPAGAVYFVAAVVVAMAAQVA